MQAATAIQKAPQGAQTIEQMLVARREFLAKVLPKHITPERLIKVALFARARNPKLLKCTAESLLKCVLECAELGLEPSGGVGGAHLVPFENRKTSRTECQLITDYRGLIDLARRSGQILSIEAHVIHENDKFNLKFGLQPELDHVPCLKGDPGPVLAVYAVAKLRDGAVQVEVMTRSDVEKIRARSKASSNGPWVTDYEMMAKKSVLRQLCKYLPRSTELQKALDLEDSVEGEVVPMIEMALPVDLQTQATPPISKTEQVKQAMKAKTVVVDVAPGESEEEAEARMPQEPPSSESDMQVPF